MQKTLRKGKVLIDWSQNDEHKTTINVYSLRAKATPTVSTPLQWSEVESVAKKGDSARLVFESDAVLKRVKKHGDLFEPLLTLKQRLPSPVNWILFEEAEQIGFFSARADPFYIAPATCRAASGAISCHGGNDCRSCEAGCAKLPDDPLQQGVKRKTGAFRNGDLSIQNKSSRLRLRKAFTSSGKYRASGCGDFD